MARPDLRVVAPAGRPSDGPVADEDIISAVARGDEDAFSSLIDRHGGAVRGVVRRVVRDPSQSDEVVQEVLLEAWRIASRFDPERGGVRTWLVTMAHRRAVDRVRSEQASRDRTARAGAAAHDIPYDQVAEEVETTLDRERVRVALSALTDIQREAITLAYYQGYTYREVAELLGVPLSTIKTRMRDGLIRLRDALEVDA